MADIKTKSKGSLKNKTLIKTRLKKGDKVVVITGNDRGKTGEIRVVDRKNQRVLVTGVNIVKRHEKPKTKNEPGKIVDKEAPIHISNVMLVDPKTGKGTRIKMKIEGNKKVRIAVKSGEIIK